MSNIVTIVAKGPSAIHAQKWIDACPGSDVAIINEAGLLLRKNQPIRFCFFCHARFMPLARPLWGRTMCFVSPAELIGSQKLPRGFPEHKRIRYAGNKCGGNREALRTRLQAGGVPHNHTMTAAMSWLAKIGYKRIRIIGVGGQGYARGLVGQPNLPANPGAWLAVERTLTELLRELYGVKVERFHASNHPRKGK
jgi:hypothetical protein